MEQTVFKKQQKKSDAILRARLVVASLMIIAGIVISAILSGWIAFDRVTLVNDQSITETYTGNLVKVQSSQFVFSGVTTGEEGKKPKSYDYFVPVYDEDDYIVEVYVVESKRDYLADEELEEDQRPTRTFYGYVDLDGYRSLHKEALLRGT